MNRVLFTTAYLLGATVVLWMASDFVGSNALALAVTLLIGCVYTIGFIELLQFRQGTSTLTRALCELPTQAANEMAPLNGWLATSMPGCSRSMQRSTSTSPPGDR